MGVKNTPQSSDLDLTLSAATPGKETGRQAQQGSPHKADALQSWGVVALPALAFAGVQLAWAVQIGHATAQLRKLGLSDRKVGLAWLAGPVTGVLVQPVVGVLSDRCTLPMGRRRPFMVVGSVLVLFGLVAFGWAGTVARWVGDPIKPSGGGSRTGLHIAILSFWVLDFSINLLQTPTRALLADIVPSSQQPLGNAFFAIANGFGKALGYSLGSYAESIQVINGVAGLLVVILTLIPVLTVAERQLNVDEMPHSQQNDETPDGLGGLRSTLSQVSTVIGKTFAAAHSLPRTIRKVFLVQWFTYLSLMLTFIYISDWAGRDVMSGNADAPPKSSSHHLFEVGVRLANRGLLFMSLLSMLLSPMMPTLCRKIGTRVTWGTSLLVMGIALLFVCSLHNVTILFCITVAMAPALSAAFTIPWTICTIYLRGRLAHEKALYLAVFNLSQATPGIIASTFGSIIVHAAHGNLNAALVAAGAAATVAAFATLQVEVPEEMSSGNVTVKEGRTSNIENHVAHASREKSEGDCGDVAIKVNRKDESVERYSVSATD